ncbi:MAG: beta-propeller domain-containing protein [Methanoregulaceae archaeon]|nr:beta-propeller domain-containing protein [Methanoregulaceae archaeon]
MTSLVSFPASGPGSWRYATKFFAVNARFMSSARNTLRTDMSRKGLILTGLATLLLVAILIAGCMSTPVFTPVTTDLKKFNSTSEVEQYIRESMASEQQNGYTGSWGSGAVPMGIPRGTSQESAKDSMAIPAAAPALGGGADGDYSQTNVQVAGVDEPDIVKNDARYIYTISGSTLAIVDAYPAETASVVSETEIGDTPKDLFVTGDRLVIFTTGWGVREDIPADTVVGVDGMRKIMPVPPRTGSTTTHAVIYDISDRKNPVEMKDYTIDGNYIDARMIGTVVYMVTREQVYPYYNDHIVIPVLREGTRTVIQPDVYYFDNHESQYMFTTITSFDAKSGNELDAQTYLLGTGDLLYVSTDAIYVSYQRYHPIVYPMRGGIEPAVVSVGSGSSSGVSTVSSPVRKDFNTLSGEERASIISDLRTGEQDVIQRQEADQTSTVIHKIGISGGTIKYAAKGEVPGVLHNQFSMDEYNNNLRVATTSSVYTRSGQYTYNNVFVLDSGMKTVGTLTHIAEQETIYSTRFIGDRLYMVTFRRIDPFFVIDLSTPENPKILGKLKIPGYSDYLHPYDANHIIGIGKETSSNEWGGVSTSGVKLALFDVSDVENPKQIDKVQIGDAGSDSAALNDHHAFLFDRNKNLLVIPIRAVSMDQVVKGDYYGNRQQVWYGAYVFGLTPESGFALKGTVQHGAGDSGYYYYGSSNSEVKRSLYIGNVLYTMSTKQIKANPLDNINTTIATVPLPGFGDVLYPEVKEAGV